MYYNPNNIHQLKTKKTGSLTFFANRKPENPVSISNLIFNGPALVKYVYFKSDQTVPEYSDEENH